MDRFFKQSRVYAVVGASSAPEKFGNKVFKWYKDRNIPAMPINPKGETILGIRSLDGIGSLSIPVGNDVGLSVITPPQASEALVQSIINTKLPVSAIWFQPGSHTPEVLDLARECIPTVIEDCILINGDKYLGSKL